MADRGNREQRHDRHRRDSRSQSPRRHHSSSHRPRSPHRHHHRKRDAVPAKELPFNTRPLTKRDFKNFRPMFALYLDIQKGKILEEMDEVETQGRWKSFIGKWNRGELAEGWYDPETLQKATRSTQAAEVTDDNHRPEPSTTVSRETDERHRNPPPGHDRNTKDDSGSESDDSIGPALPGQEGRSRGRMGPSIPNIQDLELKREMDSEDAHARREDMRFARKSDRKEQKAALDELVPRAEAGTRERQLEKKKEVNEKMKSFREKSPGAAEVPDSELMGGGDGIETFKKTKQEFERKKNERELRREEILRARMAEREERLQEYRTKEEGTMEMLKALAKQRFG
ncbi:hypothetical protein HYFRA_00008843 [Hymenoscyphus fraxineus]|uniref:RNA helicase HEL117 n=1 Tax=Hymenoscyphus fraxineus TaxID=746836 RepID=A0A9N9PVW1_9HELO|nr:hypothetical protein HYFRA_00008843 [Hymenoscyphus fraxineus]